MCQLFGSLWSVFALLTRRKQPVYTRPVSIFDVWYVATFTLLIRMGGFFVANGMACSAFGMQFSRSRSSLARSLSRHFEDGARSAPARSRSRSQKARARGPEPTRFATSSKIKKLLLVYQRKYQKTVKEGGFVHCKEKLAKNVFKWSDFTKRTLHQR